MCVCVVYSPLIRTACIGLPKYPQARKTKVKSIGSCLDGRQYVWHTLPAAHAMCCPSLAIAFGLLSESRKSLVCTILWFMSPCALQKNAGALHKGSFSRLRYAHSPDGKTNAFQVRAAAMAPGTCVQSLPQAQCAASLAHALASSVG
jgi:hypothetical protein